MEIKVVVLDSTKLELMQDAKKGDIINLSTLSEIDSSFIQNLIQKNKNEELDKMVRQAKADFEKQQKASEDALKADYEKQFSQLKLSLESKSREKEKEDLEKISKLNEQISLLTKEKESSIKEAELRKDSQYQLKIQELNSDIEKNKAELEKMRKENQTAIENLKNSNEQEKELVRINTETKFNGQISDLKNQLMQQKASFEDKTTIAVSNAEKVLKERISALENEKQQLSFSKENALLQKEKEMQAQVDKVKEENNYLKAAFDELNRTKSSLNVKVIGENLESWCNDSFHNAQTLGGFENCTWEKDNTLVKNEGETGSGSKADFIFKAYSGTGENRFLVTSACMDMKSENPDSTNKKKNSDYFKKLDSDRKKKQCEYALLVSELEMKTDQDVPILRVQEYENMYVVRPQYMLTFLGILMNLGKKYSYLLQEKAKEDEKFKSSEEIEAEFEKFKETYLNKPLEALNKKVVDIKKNADEIIKRGSSISNTADEIITSTLEGMKDKMNTFQIKLSKTEKKIENL